MWLRSALLSLALIGLSPHGGPPTAGAQTSVTFRQAMAMVEQHNERWRAADVAMSRALETRAVARGLYWPRVAIVGGYAHMSDELFVNLAPLQNLLSALHPDAPIPPLRATVLKNDPVRITVGESWTVFAGGRIGAANRAADAAVDAADAGRSATRQGLITELVDRYFKRRLVAEVLGVRKRALETLDHHVQNAMRLREAGQIAQTEVLRAQVARAEADRELKVATRNVGLASAALEATLGVDQSIDPATPLPTARELDPRERFAIVADSANADLRRLAALQEMTRQETRAASADYLPAVRLLGQQELLQENLNSTAVPNWLVGVALEWELFDGLGREHRVSAARHAEREVKLRREGARRDVATVVQSRYDEYASAAEQYTALKSSLDLAEESLRSEQRAFAEGVGTSLAVVDAELALSRIQVGRLTTQYEAVVALARLLEASGESHRIMEYVQ